jgi:hypothetical protein
MKPDHLRPGVDVGMEVRDETTLRILLPAKQCHVDIRYDAGAGHLHGHAVRAEARSATRRRSSSASPMSGIHCDQLGELVFGEDAKPWSQPFGGIVDMTAARRSPSSENARGRPAVVPG